MNAWQGNVCMEYVVDEARQQRSVRYDVFEKDDSSGDYPDELIDEVEARATISTLQRDELLKGEICNRAVVGWQQLGY